MPHYTYHIVDILNHYHRRTYAGALLEVLRYAALNIGHNLLTLFTGERFAELRQIILKELIGILIYMEYFTVYVNFKCLFHCGRYLLV